jgi:hypothetical protein
MRIGHPPHQEQGHLDEVRGPERADGVLKSHEQNAVVQARESPGDDDEFLAALSPLLEEAARLQADQSPRRETDDLLLLLEENARLRKLAVKLSNLLGDLPERAAGEIQPE